MRPSPIQKLFPHSSAVDVTDQPHSSGQQLCSAFSADCQPVQLTSEDSSHPAQHLSSRRRLQSLSQGQATPEDQQPSPVASLPVASSDSGSLSQVRRSSQVEGIGTALVHDSAAIESVKFAPIVDKGSLKECSCKRKIPYPTLDFITDVGLKALGKGLPLLERK